MQAHLDFTKIDFPGNQFVKKESEKKTIVLHHSAGWDNARGMFHNWAKDNQGRVATAYGIVDNGTIFRGFDASKYWAYAIYVNSKHNLLPGNLAKFKTHKQDILLNKQAIQIEICNGGYLTYDNNNFYTWFKHKINPQQTTFYKDSYRGHKWYEKYTIREIQALERIIIYHAIKDNISVKFNPEIETGKISERAIRGSEGIWSHANYRTDKSDIHPQPELISMLMKLEDTLDNVKCSL